jgi:hypothetical protein
MSESLHLSEAVVNFSSQTDNGWFLPIQAAIEGLSAGQAAIVPARGFNSVWAVVNHVWFCQANVLMRLQGRPADQLSFGEGEDWPPLGDPLDESAWQSARERLLAGSQALSTCVAGLTPAELAAPHEPGQAQRWHLIQGVIAHNSYHACEVIGIRHMQGLWLREV